MKQRKFTNSLIFFVTDEMFQKVKNISDKKEISFSELLRNIVEEYLTKEEVQNELL